MSASRGNQEEEALRFYYSKRIGDMGQLEEGIFPEKT